MTRAWETAATCEADGKVVYTCQLCGETQEVAIPAPGHAWDEGKVTKEPTCETEGEKTYTCAECGATRTEAIPAAGHTPDGGKVTKEPTCTRDGVRLYTCTVCGMKREEAIPAAGHDWGGWQTLRQATEDAPGEQERTCKTCGATQTREVDYQGDMPKTGVFTVPTAWLVLRWRCPWAATSPSSASQSADKHGDALAAPMRGGPERR